jgi:hypothetical protein
MSSLVGDMASPWVQPNGTRRPPGAGSFVPVGCQDLKSQIWDWGPVGNGSIDAHAGTRYGGVKALNSGRKSHLREKSEEILESFSDRSPPQKFPSYWSRAVSCARL